MAPSPVYREACDDCHFRKIRCIPATGGGCLPCLHNGRTCILSPRQKMGRPRRRRTDSKPPGNSNRTPAHNPRSATESTKQLTEPLPAVHDPIHVPAHIENLFAPGAWADDHWPWSDGLSKDQGESTDLFRESLPLENQSMDDMVDLRLDTPSDFSNYGDFPGEMALAQPTAWQSMRFPIKSAKQDLYQTPPSLFMPFPTDTVLPPMDQLSSSVGEVQQRVYLTLSNLQFNLHRQESQLSEAERNISDLAQVRGLDLMLTTVGSLCDVVRQNFDTQDQASTSKPNGAQANPAMYVLAATTALKALDVYEILVRIARRHPSPRQSSNATAADPSNSRGDTRLPSLDQSSSSSSSTSSVSSMVLDARLQMIGSEHERTTNTGVGSYRPCPELNQVIILTAIDFHLAFFDGAFNRLQRYTATPDNMSYLEERYAKIGAMRKDIQSTLRASRGC